MEANEPDTIEYQFYINGSETKCIVHETYRNSEAAIAHNDGVASQKILPRIFSISTISRFDVYGILAKNYGKCYQALECRPITICLLGSAVIEPERYYDVANDALPLLCNFYNCLG